MNFLQLVEIIQSVLDGHPKDCIFIRNASQIASRLYECRYFPADDLLRAIEHHIIDAEVYCPHEGINRLP